MESGLKLHVLGRFGNFLGGMFFARADWWVRPVALKNIQIGSKGYPVNGKPSQQMRNAVFEVEAQHQEVLRAQLAFTPLSTGEAAKSTKGKTVLEEQVGRKACKRLSARRLQINDEQFAKHPIWSLPTCFCDSNLKPFSVGTLSLLVFKPSKLDCSLSSQATLSGYVRNLYVVIKYYD